MLSAPVRPTEGLAAVERARFNLAEYSRETLKVKTKAATIEALVFNQAQTIVQAKLAAQLVETGRIRAVILKARQEGVSTLVAARNFRSCHLWSGTRAMVVADKSGRSGDLFEIYERYRDYLPTGIKPQTKYSAHARHMVFSAPNGPDGLDSQIECETAKDVFAGRGTTIHRLHMSEYAFWEKAVDVSVSLLQAVPDYGSEVIVESTANGVGNPFHRLWEAAEDGASGWIAIFLPWWIHEEYSVAVSDTERAEIMATLSDWERDVLEGGIGYEGENHRLTVEQLAWRRRTIAEKLQGDERAFRQEYPSTAEEAFLTSGSPFFDEEALLRYRRSAQPPKYRANPVELKGRTYVLQKAERGYLRVWKRPEIDQPCPECKGEPRNPREQVCGTCEGRLSVPCRYVIFGDTAEGKQIAAGPALFSDPDSERGGTDFSCADIYELESKTFVAQWHGRVAPEFFARQIAMLGHLYSSPDPDHRTHRRAALIGVERNHSSGQTVLRTLREEIRYPNLFWMRKVNVREDAVKPTDVLGWVTDGNSRPVMLDSLARALREDGVKYPNRAGIGEFYTFVRAEDGRPEAQEGCHDDRVITAAGCLELARRVPKPSKGGQPPLEVRDTPTGY